MNEDCDMIEKVKELWIDTFHDSREYVDMVIDHYYDDNLCRRRYIDGELISSAIMIPYSLKLVGKYAVALKDVSMIDESESSRNIFRGVKCGYLCGLATVEKWRGRGIMASLISECEDVAIQNGFSAVALIPADDGLRKYYSRLGYHDSACLQLIDARRIIKKISSVGIADTVSMNIDDIICKHNCGVTHTAPEDIPILNLVDILKNISDNISDGILTENREYIYKLNEDIFCLYNVPENRNMPSHDILYDIVDILINGCSVYEGVYCGNLLIHDSQQWLDIFSDILREGGAIYFRIDNTQNMIDKHPQLYVYDNLDKLSDIVVSAAVCITSSSKIIPLFGDLNATCLLIGQLIDSINSNVDSDTDFSFTIQCRDACEAKSLMEYLLSDEKSHCFEFSRREEKYGMIKFLSGEKSMEEISSPDPSSVSMRLMLD